MKTISDTIEKFREKFKDLSHVGCDNSVPCGTVIIDVEQFIILEIKMILEGLKGEEMYKNKKFDIGNPDEYAQYKFGNGSNKRESKLREDIEEIIK